MRRTPRPGFTLIELLISISVISILASLLMPTLGRARSEGRRLTCINNLKQLGYAWQAYADDHMGLCMPQVWSADRPPVYWWGANGDPPDYSVGLIYPYLEIKAGIDNVFDCPEQPWGTYVPQGAARAPTTTYGYNGLYLCPPHSGWGWGVGSASVGWPSIEQVESASQVFVFADTLMDWTGEGYVTNNCLLDGPQMPAGTQWTRNAYPTLCFRHLGRACILYADTHAGSVPKEEAHLTSTVANIGYVGEDNAPHYVPDWREWF
ncbi:MAG: DUF1559 domain-containing protein [Candidatus Brocadiia bacterium]